MAIDTSALMALEGNLVVGVKTNSTFSMTDLVRLKKDIKNGIYDKSYDMNGDGILDNSDVEILQKIILADLF